MQVPFFRLISCVSLAFVVAGCGARLAGTHDFMRPLAEDKSVVIEEIDSVIIIDDSPVIEQIPEIVMGDSVVMLIDKARIACDEAIYSQADSLLRRACLLIDSTGPSDMELEAFYEDIAHIYAIQLPPQYSENIPEQVSALVFRYQMNFSLDSLTSEIDSSLFARNCLRGMPYNVPISKNSRVRKALTLTLNHRFGYIQNSLKRGSRYIPFMKKVFSDSGLPTDLVYLPIIESGFNYRAYSHAHAAGVWQFIPSTGRIYGLRKNYWMDERRDPIKATFAAVRYLKKLYGDFNDWHLALAAYNCGEGRVARTIKTADTSDYWQLRLPRETMNYVPHYLATMMVAKNPSCFGLDIPVMHDTLVSMDTVLISDCIDMKKIAQGISIPVDTLKDLNPHILRWCTPPEVTDVTLYLPHGKAAQFREFYAGLDDKDKVKWYRYRIQRGDNLSTIAQRFKISFTALRSVNDLRSSRIIAGRHLFIPIPVDGPAQQSKTATVVAQSGSTRAQNKVPVPPHSRKVTYRLKRGDTMHGISKRYGVSIEQICGWNNIDQPERLTAGQALTIYTRSVNGKQKHLSTSTKFASIPKGARKKTYRVGKGDNLYSLSKKLNVEVAELAGWNKKNLRNPLIHPGENLIYYLTDNSSNSERPAASEGKKAASTEGVAGCKDCRTYKVSAGDNIYRLSRLFEVDMQEILACNGLSKNDILQVGDILKIPSSGKKTSVRQTGNKLVYYRVQKGDNLWRIAQLFEIPVKKLYEVNHLNPGTVLMPGDTVRVVLAEEL
ncbi:MAG: LysM peptidoglycan-binding domain-containing protein [Chitinispirillaceae bacterium]